LFDGKSDRLLSKQVIVIQSDRIADVGPAGSVKIPAGAEEIDLGTSTVPGLIEGHNHMFKIGDYPGTGAEAAVPLAAERLTTLDEAAQDYVHLVLEIGAHEKGYVDAYFGAQQWRNEAEAHPRNIFELKAETDRIQSTLWAMDTGAQQPMERRRNAWLKANVMSARSRLDIIEGARFRFRDEATRLFALMPGLRPLESYDLVLERIEALLPGSGMLAERVEAFRNRYVIPSNRLDAVIGAAIAECRPRTLAHIQLPANEHFKIEFVTSHSWGAYNWYQGGNQSLIQGATRAFTRRSGIASASRWHTPSLRSASRNSSSRPASGDWLPPAKSPARTAGRSKGSSICRSWQLWRRADARGNLFERRILRVGCFSPQSPGCFKSNALVMRHRCLPRNECGKTLRFSCRIQVCTRASRWAKVGVAISRRLGGQGGRISLSTGNSIAVIKSAMKTHPRAMTWPR
jgi:hypothetical protein